MAKRYSIGITLPPPITECQSCSHPTSNRELSALVLRPDDVARLAGLVEQLMEFHNAIIYLQSDDIDFVTVRAIFDGLLGHFAHSDAIKPYLSATRSKLGVRMRPSARA